MKNPKHTSFISNQRHLTNLTSIAATGSTLPESNIEAMRQTFQHPPIHQVESKFSQSAAYRSNAPSIRPNKA
ncbi:hypothetical protein BDA96_07G142000 [Sorghum bicolor]|uniref:Uncharacterized protein n=2 Tax=Sorghum bicolor TaxID=4558 RepID=A0A921U9Q8_SORBI|nr:hypothetical protein BDA96_07G142000 [Sorghum bicolor]OQU80475.1 hypothetical protein SORBI_3007G132650 [Sorghum bicolor]